MTTQHAPTAIIVGSGPGGLASALLLAHSGVKVTVLEKADAVGGRTRLYKKDGYTFDRGPTFFHYPEVIEEIFQAIGRDAHKELGLMPLDPMYRLVFGAGGHIDATSNLDEMTERIRELAGDKNANGFKNYVKQNRKKLELSKKCLQTPWRSPLDILSKRAMRELPLSSSRGQVLLAILAGILMMSESDLLCPSKPNTSA